MNSDPSWRCGHPSVPPPLHAQYPPALSALVSEDRHTGHAHSVFSPSHHVGPTAHPSGLALSGSRRLLTSSHTALVHASSCSHFIAVALKHSQPSSQREPQMRSRELQPVCPRELDAAAARTAGGLLTPPGRYRVPRAFQNVPVSCHNINFEDHWLVAQLLGASSCASKGCRFNSLSGTYLGHGLGPW